MYAPMIAPSMMRHGSPSSKMRSLNVPGSDSSALMTKYLGVSVDFIAPSHLIHVGKAAPPRPSNPDCFNCSDHVLRRERLLEDMPQGAHAARRFVFDQRRGVAASAQRRDDADVAAHVIFRRAAMPGEHVSRACKVAHAQRIDRDNGRRRR